MHSDMITIHNKYEDSDGNLVLTSTLIEGCFYIKDESVSIKADLSGNADVVYASVPESRVMNASRKLVDKYDFENASDDEKKLLFTMASGDWLSFGDETRVEKSSPSTFDNYDNTFEISAVGYWDKGGLPHYEVSAH